MMRPMGGQRGGLPLAAIAAAVLYFGDNIMGWIIVLSVVAGVAGLLWAAFDYYRSHRVQNEYQEFAKSHGWEFAERTYEYNSRFSSFPFGTGNARRQESVVRGTYNGQQCATFAQVYELSSEGQGTPTAYANQITLAELPVALPRLDIVPKNLPLNVANALRGRDIEMESWDFNQRWRVLCDDPRYGHAVIDPRMIERLLFPDVEGLAVRIEGGAVYVWGVGRQGSANLAKRLGVVSGIARRIPDHVIREYTELGYTVQRGSPATRPISGPAWATEPGALTSRRYTGVGVDADGDGIEDWKQLR